MKRLVIIFTAFVISLSMHSRAYAILLSVDDSIFGIDAVTQDTLSGLEWLDVHFSVSLSYEYVVSQYSNLGEFSGWRHASLPEVQNLFTNAGILNSGAISTTNFLPANNLRELLGTTYGNSLNGTTSTIDESSDWRRFATVGSIGDQGFTKFNFTVNPSWSYDDVGHFLVRKTAVDPNANSVPEPISIVLFGPGILATVLIRGSRKENGTDPH